MNFSQLLAAYINLNMLVIAGSLSLIIYQALARLTRKIVGAGDLLRLHYISLSMLLLILLSYPILPERKIANPSVKIWCARSIETLSQEYSPHEGTGYVEIPGRSGANSFSAENIDFIGSIILCTMLLIGVVKIGCDWHRLFVIRRGSYLIRRYRSVSIYANDRIGVPFSHWLPGKTAIFIPTELVGRGSDYYITLLHELQHHRNGDTKWVYILWFLRSICILNPCIHLWDRLISELQEFACDEVLVDRKKIDSQAYARCLFAAANSASDGKLAPVRTTGLMFIVNRKLLKRRIEKMREGKNIKLKWRTSLMVMTLILGLMVSLTFASKGAVQDRRITESQAIGMAEKARSGSDFPIVINEFVLKQLNTYLGTPEGREFMKSSLSRMEDYRKGIEARLNQYGVPEELLAIPLVESGYQNLEAAIDKQRGTGIWMFIASTARKYGLSVDDKVDERLDVDILTDAAMRYLLANRLRFNDWPLSVLAYNIGESNVQNAIDETGSRNVWDLITAGYENDADYYAKFMAAVIIMRNPDSVN